MIGLQELGVLCAVWLVGFACGHEWRNGRSARSTRRRERFERRALKYGYRRDQRND